MAALAWLQQRRYPALWCALLAAALLLPSLGTGRILDDEVQWVMAQDPDAGLGLRRAPHDLFAFIEPGATTAGEPFQAGVAGWWSSPSLHITFFRPVSSGLTYLDHQLFGRRAWPAHIHSVLWFGLLVLVVHRFFARVATHPSIATLATLLFAVDDAHGLAVGWLANRNAMISCVLGVLAVTAHIDARRAGRAAPIAPAVLLVVSLLAGEMGVSVAAWVVAWAITMEQGSWRQRLLSVLPATVVVVAWRVLYVGLGYRTAASGLYIDPAADPLVFVGAAASRMPALLAGQFTPISPDVWILFSETVVVYFAVACLLVVVAVAVALRRVVADGPEGRFAVLGLLGAAIPVCATMPNERLLFPIGLGGSLLVATALIRGRQLGLSRAVVAALFATHLVLAPLLLPLKAWTPRLFSAATELARDTVDETEARTAREVFVVHSPDHFLTNFVPVWRRAAGMPALGTWRVLGPTSGELIVERPDAETLVLRAPDGFLPSVMDSLMRSQDEAFVHGEQHDLGNAVIDVIEVRDGRAYAIAFSPAGGLTSEGAAWVVLGEDGYADLELPEVGERVVLAPVSVPRLVLNAVGRQGAWSW